MAAGTSYLPLFGLNEYQRMFHIFHTASRYALKIKSI